MITPSNLCPSPNSIMMRMVKHNITKGEMRNAHETLVVISEENIALGRLRRRWKSDIKMDLQEIRFEYVN
jgi:hypothetical protein